MERVWIEPQLRDWFTTCTRRSTMAMVSSSELYASWTTWVIQKGGQSDILTQKAMSQFVVNQGFSRHKSNGRSVFPGLMLRTD